MGLVNTGSQFLLRPCRSSLISRGGTLLIVVGVPVNHPLDESLDLLEPQKGGVHEMLVSAVLKQFSGDQRSRELLFWPHGTLLSMSLVVVIRPLSVNLRALCEEVLIEAHLVHQDLLLELVYVVNEPGFVASSRQGGVKALVVLQLELYAKLWRSVLDANVLGYNDL